jgi:hypothetical protein
MLGDVDDEHVQAPGAAVGAGRDPRKDLAPSLVAIGGVEGKLLGMGTGASEQGQSPVPAAGAIGKQLHERSADQVGDPTTEDVLAHFIGGADDAAVIDLEE